MSSSTNPNCITPSYILEFQLSTGCSVGSRTLSDGLLARNGQALAAAQRRFSGLANGRLSLHPTDKELPMTVSSSVPFRASLGEMDPESKALMAALPRPTSPPSLEMIRDGLRRSRPVNQPDLPHMAKTREFAIAGKHGDFQLRYHRGMETAKNADLPVLVWFHGGGWAVGDLDSHDWVCRAIANAASYAVVNVDYHLAPEHRFPVAFDDAETATRWVFANAAMLKIDPAHILVGGDSAGGNLAAATALALLGDPQIKLHGQVLAYPITDLTFEYDPRFESGVALTNGDMRVFMDHYVPDHMQRRDWRCSPLLAPSLKDLPPTEIILAGFDPLYDEGEAYATRLASEGVETRVARFPGQMHGFISRPKLMPKAYEAISEIAAFLKTQS
ncbi:alpha/beta hydrolase [Rhizobium sp. C4]|uniref:alpha/beta hydrolase n=1 Tax=Rhizobium sp. C4 TaxID=1349800 RepID=UPI001E2F927E|nr:alpha/beta hydrolase [Rhizobium sp. C4]MCD2173660.1 alpha/beta hydrolase [Rhizobium sp. C4]